MEIYKKCYESVKKKSLIDQTHLVIYRVADVGIVLAVSKDALRPFMFTGRLLYSALGIERTVYWWVAQANENVARKLSSFKHGRVIAASDIDVIKQICLLKPNFKWYNRDFTNENNK